METEIKPMRIGKRIKKHRREVRLTQEKLGPILNVTGQTILNWEKGLTEPRGNDLIAVETWLDATRKPGCQTTSA